MKNKIFILLIIGLFFPTMVFAHEAYTKVDVDIFYGEQNSEYQTLLTALDDLSQDEELKDKFRVIIHSPSESITTKVYNYVNSTTNKELLTFIDYSYFDGFTDKKYYTGSTTISSIYTNRMHKLKNTILTAYESPYSTLLDDIKAGVFDTTIDEPTTVYSSTDGIDPELENFIKEFKEKVLGNKFLKQVFYSIVFLIVLKICANTLKNSIHKNH